MKKLLWALGLATVLLVAVDSRALISLKFTPVQMVEACRNIVPAEVAAPLKDRAALTLGAPLKGPGLKGTAIDVSETDDAVLQKFKALFEDRKKVAAMVFTGDLSTSSETGVNKADLPAAVIQVGTEWFGLNRKDDETWALRGDPFDLSRVWGGSAEMLLEVTRYVMSDPAPEVPAKVDTTFTSAAKLSNIKGAIGNMQLAVLGPQGARCVLVTSDAGDRLFALASDGAPPTGVTEKMRLTSRSRAACWGNFSGSGRADLLSWDGKKFSLHVRGEAGTFTAQPVEAEIGSCLGLSALDAGTGKQAAALVATSSWPALLVPGEAGVRKVRPLGHGELPGAGACVAADFDGDGLTDIAQVVPAGMLFYKGIKPGEFGEPARCEIPHLGSSPILLCDDYDGDGRLDLVAISSAGPRLLRNVGAGRFADIEADSGELDYHSRSKPDISAAARAEVNQDSRPGLTLFYAEGMPPLSFFNRGFACFGLGREIALNMLGEKPEGSEAISAGQRAGLWSDLNGDGSDDLLVIAPNGDLWAFYTKPLDPAPLAVRVALPSSVAGPLVVTASDGKRNLGARLLTSAQPAVFYKRSKGPLDLQWKTADGQNHNKRVIVLQSQALELPAGE